MKQVVLSELAAKDLEAIIDYLLVEAGIEVATSFLTSWDKCRDHIGRFPESGSPRLAHRKKLRGMRVWPISNFPHLAIYAILRERVEIARVLHMPRDIPARFRE